MIDLERRRTLALNLRHISVGLISNDDFESNVADTVSDGWLPEQYHRSKKAKTDDAAIVPILELSWGLYSDLESRKLKGKYKLDDETLRIIARCILFLRSDLEYQWPQCNQQMSTFEFWLLYLVLDFITNFFKKRTKRQLLEGIKNWEITNIGHFLRLMIMKKRWFHQHT